MGVGYQSEVVHDGPTVLLGGLPHQEVGPSKGVTSSLETLLKPMKVVMIEEESQEVR